jgi:FkbM family methyltransferase
MKITSKSIRTSLGNRFREKLLFGIFLVALAFFWAISRDDAFGGYGNVDGSGLWGFEEQMTNFKAQRSILPVSCGDHNGDNVVKFKKLTALDPPFWISLHSKKFDTLRWTIMRTGQYYEKGITGMFEEILRGKPKGMVLDVGMNIGWFSLLSRSFGHDVVSFEPNRMHIDRMCESLKLNSWDGDASVTIFRGAMGSELGTMTLSWKAKNAGSGNVTEGKTEKWNSTGSGNVTEGKTEKWNSTKEDVIRSVKTRVLTIDRLADQEGWLVSSLVPIYLMKVDVEGFEPKVFAGAKRLIRSGKVRNILMEISPPYDQEKKDLLEHLVKVGGYQLMSISDSFGRERKDLLSKVQAVNDIPNNLHKYASVLKKAISRAKRTNHFNLWFSLD